MFGPNYFSNFHYDMTFSHRSEDFKLVYKDTVDLISDKFGLQEYDIIPIVGSGTTAMETLIMSSKFDIDVIGNEGKFKDRWKNLSSQQQASSQRRVELYCQLETSKSSTFMKEGCFVDGISSFPFYDIPKNTLAFVTCANKQIGAYPGLSFIFVRKDCWNLFKEEELFHTRNLSLYRKHFKNNQTPTTCPVQIFEQLNKCLQDIDFQQEKQKIIQNSSLLEELLSEFLIGEKTCPVLTFHKEAVPDALASKYKIYNYNNDSAYYQIFTYSAPQEEYYNFYKDLKDARY